MALVKAMLARLLQLALVTLFVTAGTAILLRVVPGDPAQAILGEKASEAMLDTLRQQLAVDEPLIVQIRESLTNLLLRGDLGTSFAHPGREVTELIGPALVVTATLAGVAVVISLLIGVPLGLGLALVRRSEVDVLGRLLVTALLAVPSFMIGLMLLYVISLRLNLASAGGWAGQWPDNLEYVWLPAVALSVYLIALIARTVRQAALETIGMSFVEAARTRGVSRRRIVLFHVLPNAVLPVIPLVGFNAGILVGGAVTIEAVFSLPGIGAQLVEGMQRRDLPIVQGIALITGVSIVAFNLLADLVQIAADPRLRSSR